MENVKAPSELPTVCDTLINTFDEYGESEALSFEPLEPIWGSAQTGIAGEDGNTRTADYVGHVAYSPDFNTLVYQIERNQTGILHSIPGEGLAISEKIIEMLHDVYGAEYVFCGMRESGTVFVIPVEEFNQEWHTDKYDSQLYATLSEDVQHEIPNGLSDILTAMPTESDATITLHEALENI